MTDLLVKNQEEIATNVKPRISGAVPSMLQSKLLYTHRMHRHHIEAVGFTDEFLKGYENKIRRIEKTLAAGYRFGDIKQVLKFYETVEYCQFQHLCDIQSGAYFDVLGKFAKQLFIKSGAVAGTDFECYLSHKTRQVPPEYIAHRESYYVTDIYNKTHKLTLEEVEKYALSVANGGSF